jgi:hypothetical protein
VDVAVDETHVQVLKENGRRAEDKSWMWVNKALVKIIKELPLAKNIEDFERLADVIFTPENPV